MFTDLKKDKSSVDPSDNSVGVLRTFTVDESSADLFLQPRVNQSANWQDPIQLRRSLGILSEMFNKEMTIDDVVELIGAPRGSIVEISQRYDSHRRLYFIGISAHGDLDMSSGEHLTFSMYRSLYDKAEKTFEPKRWCLNNDIRVAPAGTGIGARIFAMQVRNLAAYGYEEINGWMSRLGTSEWGYCVWPRMGFNLIFKEGTCYQLDESGFPEVINSFELYDRKGGEEWWKENGVSARGIFDLREGSRSMAILNGYLKSKGIVVE